MLSRLKGSTNPWFFLEKVCYLSLPFLGESLKRLKLIQTSLILLSMRATWVFKQLRKAKLWQFQWPDHIAQIWISDIKWHKIVSINIWEVCQNLRMSYTKLIEWPSKLRIKNSVKPHRVQYILRHFYYTTMQKLCNFEALYRPEIQCKCHKGSPQKE